MARLTAALLAVPAALLFCGMTAYGHNCRHPGGCASSHHGDHGCYDCGFTLSAPDNAQPRSGPARAQTREGKVVELVYLPGSTPERAMVELRLADGTSDVLVRLGPAGFLKQNHLNLREGDTISVKGFRVTGGTEDLLIATEVTRQGQTVRFRDERGRPEW